MRRSLGLAVRLALLTPALPALLSGQGRPSPTKVDVAPGIFVFMTSPYGDVGLDGNSVAILGTDGVLVFDTNGTPAAAAAVLAEIRKITTQPVRFVVNSHWHWDHWYGTETYAQAFPDVRSILFEPEKKRAPHVSNGHLRQPFDDSPGRP